MRKLKGNQFTMHQQHAVSTTNDTLNGLGRNCIHILQKIKQP